MNTVRANIMMRNTFSAMGGRVRNHAAIGFRPLRVVLALGLCVAGLAGTAHAAGSITCSGFGGYSYALNGNIGFGNPLGYVLNDTPASISSNSGPVSGSCSGSSSGADSATTTTNALQTDSGPETFQFNGSGSAAYSVSGQQLGALHAQVSNGGSTTPYQYFYSSDGQEQAVINPLSGGGSTAAGVDWTDTITFEDPALAPGSPIDLDYTVSLDAMLTGIGDCNGAPSAQTEFALEQGSSVVFVGALNQDPYGCFPQFGSNNPANSASGEATVYSGQSYTIFGSLNILAQTFDGEAPSLDYVPSSDASVDASNTANFYLQLLTSGAYYVDSEGVTDALTSAPTSPTTSVPEPSTLALLGAALLGLGFSLRRRTSV